MGSARRTSPSSVAVVLLLRRTVVSGGTRRSTSAYAKATVDTLFAFIHGQSPWLSAKAGKNHLIAEMLQKCQNIYQLLEKRVFALFSSIAKKKTIGFSR